MEPDEETIRAVMAALGRRTSPAKQAASRENPKGKRSLESKARMQAAQQARRAQEIAEGLREPPKPKRPRGRPKKRTQTEGEGEADGNG